MFSRKKLLWIGLPVLLLAMAVAGGYYWLTPSNPQPDVSNIWEPKLTSSGGTFNLTAESTGILWQKPVKNQAGKLTELHVAYRDGRFGVYTFDKDEIVSTFKCYSADDKSVLVYEAWYKAELIQRSRFVRPDGTTESEFRRLADGTEVRDTFAADGLTSLTSVTTLPDGSQRTAVNDNGKVEVTEIKADESEQSFGQRLRDDGIYTPIFKVKLKGVRATEWEFYDVKGNLRHKGTFRADGAMEITVYNDDSKPVLKQIWRKAGEDWNRAFYRVAEVEVYNEQGNVTARAKINPDGQTPSEISNFDWNGRLNQKTVFNSRGVPLRQEMYYQYYGPGSDIPSQVQEIPPGQPPVVLNERVVGEPAGQNAKIRLYRILGTPFAEELQTDKNRLPSFFVAP